MSTKIFEVIDPNRIGVVIGLLLGRDRLEVVDSRQVPIVLLEDSRRDTSYPTILSIPFTSSR